MTEPKKRNAQELIFIGIVAENMGRADISKILKTGEAVYGYVKNMTYKEFKKIKTL